MNDDAARPVSAKPLPPFEGRRAKLLAMLKASSLDLSRIQPLACQDLSVERHDDLVKNLRKRRGE